MIYEKITSNIIKQTEQVESEIYLDKLEKIVTDLETQISNTSQKIEYQPCANENTKKAIDFYNEMNVPVDKIELESELKTKVDLLKELKGL